MSKPILAAFVLALSLSGAGAASADDFDDCTKEPQSAWKSEDDIKKVATDAGYEVRQIKTEGSCYEVYGVGSDGALMELFYNPATGELVHSKKKS